MKQSFYEFFCPVKMIAGHKALEHIPFELESLNSSKPLIITDAGVKAAGLVEHVTNVFAGDEQPVVFDNVPPDSSLKTVEMAAKMYNQHHCDSILAIGGGSVIDTSKAVNILVTLGGDDLMEYAGAHVLKQPLKPLFVIPTTAGTGSEATFVTVISDNDGIKKAFISRFMMPSAAVLDPRMTLTLPPHITAMTGMDALTHAIEAYTCLGANPLSDAYATKAISKIAANLMPVMHNPQDENARLELAEASTMGGIAFSNSMVGLVHSLGHALGGVCHLPHGMCMSIFLPYVLEYNRDKNGAKIGELLLYLAGADVYAATSEPQRADKVIELVKKLRDDLYQMCKLPRTLKETGKVSHEQLIEVAKVALNDGSIIYNPKEADLDDLMQILEYSWQ